jgi:hemoglobin
MLVDQLCEATGGPCKYGGRSMLDAHRGMNITDAEFNALVEDLVKSLDEFKVPAEEQKELPPRSAEWRGTSSGTELRRARE